VLFMLSTDNGNRNGPTRLGPELDVRLAAAARDAAYASLGEHDAAKEALRQTGYRGEPFDYAGATGRFAAHTEWLAGYVTILLDLLAAADAPTSAGQGAEVTR